VSDVDVMTAPEGAGFAGFDSSPLRARIKINRDMPYRESRVETLQTLQTLHPAPQPATERHTGDQPASLAVTWLHGLLDALGSGPKGRKVRQCPSHADSAPSLSIGQGDDGRALVHCFAGCGFGAILRALCLQGEYLVTPPPVSPEAYARAFVRHPGFGAVSSGGGHPTSRGMRLVAQHPYGDRWWLLRYRHPVTRAKELSWESINPKGERVPGLLGTPTRDLPLYRERDILKGMALDEPVLLVESESSVDALMGWYATTWAGGAACPPIERLQAQTSGS